MAVLFQQISQSRLFQSDSNVTGAGWWGFQVPLNTVLDGKPVALDAALNNSSLKATFLYAATLPDVSTAQALNDFIAAIDEILSSILSPRAIVFLPSGALAEVTFDNATIIGLTGGSAVAVNTAPTVPLCNTGALTMTILSGSALTVPMPIADTIVFTGSGSPAVSLGGLLPTETYQPDNTAALRFGGSVQGTFDFSMSIARGALKSKLNWGFQTLIPNPGADETILYFTAWLPLADGSHPNATDLLGFEVQINPVNPNNQIPASMSKLFFTGQNSDGSKTKLVSYYRTNAGKEITLYPNADSANGQQAAGLTIADGYLKTPIQNGFSLAPDGDFVVTTDNAQAGVPTVLLCGMTATETISLLPFVDGQYPGYRIRFAGQSAAFTPVFPLTPYSPISAPIDPAAPLMNSQFQTAWAGIVPPPGEQSSAFYTAAPKGADLFGLNAAQTPNLLAPASPGLTLKTTALFPLIPFAGFVAGLGQQDFTTRMLTDLDRQILGPARRTQISLNSIAAAHAHHSLKLAAAAPACPYNATTPTGFISRVACDGTFSQLLLAQAMTPGTNDVALQMGFTKLDAKLQAAFQTDNLLLIVANGERLGTQTSGTFMAPASHIEDTHNSFYNSITIADWGFSAAVGQRNRYSDYRNVMIVKGVQGRLVDLVVSPDKWTMKDVFSSPSTLQPDGTVGSADSAQLVPLSAWISDYFNAALKQSASPYFENFCNIIQLADWMGVLLLRVDLASIPKDLAGIIAGVNDPSDFYAHHVGIEISQIDAKTVQQKDSSSMFGLVYYVDPSYDDTMAAHPIAPADLSQPYDFTLLTLKALFKNSVLTKFESLAEVVLNDVFGSTVSGMGTGGNIYNAILLEGALQKHGDTAVYSLASTATTFYLLANNVLTEVEIGSAVMSTRDDGSVSGEVVSWISMTGFMNFAVVTDTTDATPPQPDFDIFSFGGPGGTPTLGQGLNFNNLGLLISIAKPPGGETPDSGSEASTLEMVESEISFNTAASTARDSSLYPNFQLELLGLQSGDAKTTPDSLSYLTVATLYGLQGVSGGAWHGLRFKLNMGTPGALAAKLNLNSTLLLAWSDTSGSKQGTTSFQASVNIQLPGAGSGGDVFSLQSVLKLSIGVIQLFYNADAKSFLLLLNEIALKFLGLLKVPPNGATAFFLFGLPNVDSSTGLGWYAIYNQETPKAKNAAVALPAPANLLPPTEAAGSPVDPQN